MNDTNVINSLTKVKGIGKWTAEMFLIFSLGRLNILSKMMLGFKGESSGYIQLKTMN